MTWEARARLENQGRRGTQKLLRGGIPSTFTPGLTVEAKPIAGRGLGQLCAALLAGPFCLPDCRLFVG